MHACRKCTWILNGSFVFADIEDIIGEDDDDEEEEEKDDNETPGGIPFKLKITSPNEDDEFNKDDVDDDGHLDEEEEEEDDDDGIFDEISRW